MAREYRGVYAYATKQGTRYRYNFRDSDRKLSCKRGLLSPQAAAIDKAARNVQAAAGTLHLSTARFEDYFESWLAGHKPVIDLGAWNDYRAHGIKRLIPEFGAKRLDEIAPASGSRRPTGGDRTLSRSPGVRPGWDRHVRLGGITPSLPGR